MNFFGNGQAEENQGPDKIFAGKLDVLQNIESRIVSI